MEEQALAENQFNTLLAEKKAIREKYKDKAKTQDNNIKMLKETLAAEKRWADKYDSRSSAQYNKGGMTKKMGYAKGGMCGASNPAARPVKKAK